MNKFILTLFLINVALSQSPHGQINIQCSSCHSTSGWKPIKEKIDFDHSTTGFRLVDSHAKVKCTDCHKKDNKGNLVFSSVGKSCSSCHFDFHTGELGNRCQDCHSFKTWKLYDVVRKHNNTRFPLSGVHASLKCESCHLKGGIFQVVSIPVEYVSCHEKNYNEAKRPDHIVLNFSKNCGDCHMIKAISWTGERAFHNRTGFPLTGAHQIISCDKCHIDWKFDVLIPTDFYSCHRIQYENAKNPNHLTAGFPTTCATCHTSSGWRPASNFDHDRNFFRIYSEEHRGKWNSCNDCHIDPNNYKNFSCITYCHSQASTDRKHRNVGGYRYESQACLSCHIRILNFADFHQSVQFDLNDVQNGSKIRKLKLRNLFTSIVFTTTTWFRLGIDFNEYRSAYLFETMKDFPDTLFDKRLRKDIRGIDEGKINVVFKSNVKEIKDKSVILTTPEGEIELPNDYVFIFIGGTLPYEFLKKVGINIVQKSGN